MKRLSIIFIFCFMLAGCSSNQPNNLNIAPNSTAGTTSVTTGTTPGPASDATSGAATTTSPSTSTGTGQRVFTLDELKKYNGQNGNPAYVAVNGLVYDVTGSRLWSNGVHRKCSDSTIAGADFSDLINSSPHGIGVMKKFQAVGTLPKKK